MAVGLASRSYNPALVILKINDNYSNTLLGGLILLAIVVDRARERFEKK